MKSNRNYKQQVNTVTELELGKIPPQAIDIEEHVLGVLMSFPSACEDYMPEIHEEYFYKEAHKIIFRAIRQLVLGKCEADILTVTKKITQVKEDSEIVGEVAYFVSQLTSKVASTSSMATHVLILKQCFIQRELIRIGATAIDNGYNANEDIFDSIEKLENDFEHINEHIAGKDYESDISVEILEQAAENMKWRENKITGVPTGHDKLTEKTMGWQKGDLIIIAARASMGKTAEAIDIAFASAESKVPVAVFSLEMSKQQLHNRMLNSKSRLDSDMIKFQTWELPEMKKYEQAALEISQLPIYINDKSGITPSYIRAVCRQRKKKYGLGLVVIDYLQLMNPNTRGRSREEEVASISKALKEIAKELNVPVIALAQVGRQVETRAGSKRPGLADLRESGAIEQDADVVVMIYRPSYYFSAKHLDGDYKDDNSVSDEEYKLLTELIIAKQRNGPLARLKSYFFDKQCRFSQYIDDKQEDLQKSQTNLPF